MTSPEAIRIILGFSSRQSIASGHTVRTLYDATKALALREGKIPVLATH